MKLFPVQQVVVKLVEGLPLDDTEKFPVRSFEPTSDGFSWTTEEFTEKRYVEKLVREGRCLVPKKHVNSEWRAKNVKSVCLVTGRRAGKGVIISEVAAADLARRVVSHTGHNMLGLLTVSTDQDQATLVLQEMLDAALRRPELEARLANETESHYRFQTDDDIRRTGTWKGSQRKASATVKLMVRSSMRIRGAFCGLELGFCCLDEADHMQANQADEAWVAMYPGLIRSAGTMMAVSSPGIKGWMRKLFGQPHVLSIRIPTWEMNPVIPESMFQEAYLRDPATFWAEYGACWLEEVHEVRPVGPPAGCWPPPRSCSDVRRAITNADLIEEMRRKVRGEKDWHDRVVDTYKGRVRSECLTRPHGHLETHRYLADYPVGMLSDRGTVPYAAPPSDVVSRVGTGMTLNEIGQHHREWQDRNFDGISSLTQALALAEETGEVARAILKEHHGIRAGDRGNVAEELADVILVASGLANRLGINIEEAIAAKATKRDKKDFRARPETG